MKRHCYFQIVNSNSLLIWIKNLLVLYLSEFFFELSTIFSHLISFQAVKLLFEYKIHYKTYSHDEKPN